MADYHETYAEGYEDGYREGHKAGREAAMAHVRNLEAETVAARREMIRRILNDE